MKTQSVSVAAYGLAIFFTVAHILRYHSSQLPRALSSSKIPQTIAGLDEDAPVTAGRRLSSSHTSSTIQQQGTPLEELVGGDFGKVPKGILSKKPRSFFQRFQAFIDNESKQEQCQRFGFRDKQKSKDAAGILLKPRRIFFGSLMANEPWELMDILAMETYGIFSGMVLVESNLTQMSIPRELRWDPTVHSQKLETLFGVPHVQIRQYVNHNITIRKLERENYQRDEIIKGWKELGMTEHDVGYIADLDETFSRDFLRAVQWCAHIEEFDYEKHKCWNPKAKLIGKGRIFESSPMCITKEHGWWHPDMVVGACIEGIGNATLHPRVPRDKSMRVKGYASGKAKPGTNDTANLPSDLEYFPLWNGADFRELPGGHFHPRRQPNHTKHNGFHFHNFFANFSTLRHKYFTYGHPQENAMTGRLEDIHVDLRLVVRCVANQTDGPTSDIAGEQEQQNHQRELMIPPNSGGNSNHHQFLPPLPIYFMDEQYVLEKHQHVAKQVEDDEQRRQQWLQMTPLEQQLERIIQEAREAKRQMYAKEEEMRTIEEAVREEREKRQQTNLAREYGRKE